MKYLKKLYYSIPGICIALMFAIGIYNLVEFHYFGILEDKIDGLAYIVFVYFLAMKMEFDKKDKIFEELESLLIKLKRRENEIY